MRNILAHIYFNVRTDVVRSTINEPLAALRDACEPSWPDTATCGDAD